MVSRQPIHDQYATGLACGVVTDAFGKDPGLICRAMLSHGSRTLRETFHESVRAVLYRSRFLLHLRPAIFRGCARVNVSVHFLSSSSTMLSL